MIRVMVADTGKGIKPQEMDRIFKQFGKLRRTAEINSAGLGLGLMICQKLIESNGGIIKVNSKGLDMGSIFSFSMKM